MKTMQERSFTPYEAEWLTDITNALLDKVASELYDVVSEMTGGTQVAHRLAHLGMRVHEIENFQNIVVNVVAEVSEAAELKDMLGVVEFLEKATLGGIGMNALPKARFMLAQYFTTKARFMLAQYFTTKGTH